MIPGYTPKSISSEVPAPQQCWKWLLLRNGKDLTNNCENSFLSEIMEHKMVRCILKQFNIFRYFICYSDFALLVREHDDHSLCYLYRKCFPRGTETYNWFWNVTHSSLKKTVYIMTERPRTKKMIQDASLLAMDCTNISSQFICIWNTLFSLGGNGIVLFSIFHSKYERI